MEAVNVKISRKLISEFKKSAKMAYPHEEYAILLGYHDENTGFLILGFYFPPDRGAFVDEANVHIQPRWTKEAQKTAKSIGLQVIGDIHSHPSGECGPSECDIDSQTASSAEIFGICGITKTRRGLRSRIRFWPSLRTIRTKVI